ncbi:uncharacterized protein LOC128869326 [Anastrepha ludens]|uniref:uncharacterized protein LOC128869326 n=1 Tax=Anastrepha ludens TaxID=28586 RepID=UPI0023B03A4D|nr:uncharacterized protein LOC128869326 [Anastrepha ludens]
MSKKRCLFTEKLKAEYGFLKSENESKVACTSCKGVFSIESRGRADIERHLQSSKHKDAMKGTQQAFISEFFKKQNVANDDLQCIAKEMTFAYHCAKHHLSFNASDCCSKLIKKFYDKKFSAGKTKLEALLVGVIGPHIFSEVLKELEIAHFITILIDTSNRKDVKILPIMVRYFSFKSGVKTKLLQINSIPGETSDIILEYVSTAIQKYSLSEKVVALSADNTNTNFGGVSRQGQKNVYRKLETKLGRSIVGIGCSAHVIHNTVQAAADSLPVDLELISVKIYKFFYIYTVRNTN